MNSRVDVVKFCIENLGFSSYLEIGCKDNFTFNQVDVKRKVGVDPDQGGTVRDYSDSFFSKNTEKFDIIFIDGDHRCRQALRDISNSLDIISDNGIVVAHDCNPWRKEDESTENIRCGDAWKAFVHFRQFDNLDCVVGDFDFGVGLLRKRQNRNPVTLGDRVFSDLSWEDLVKNRDAWMNLSDSEDLKKWILSP